jgi:tRNA modification GTPase
MFEDTIIAISTPLGFGGIGIARLSGREALPIAECIFKAKKKRQQTPVRKPILGNLYDPKSREVFEEAYLTYFPAPASYTTEDVVEISCHGSPVVLEEVVRLGIQAGARLADPGEFTLRAHLGGRIDIIQAEAINDLIRAASVHQARISYRQMEGSLSTKLKALREQMIRLLSQTEASLEFPDEGLRLSPKHIAKTLERFLEKVSRLIKSYDLGKSLAEGLTLAITGKTNVGKSTLFNTLLEKDRAIITPYPGTTRDYLRETFKIKDALFTLVDMAGLEKTSHPVEKEGIKRGKQLASQADGILLVLDASREENQEDLTLLDKYRDKKTLILLNKIDLPPKIDLKKIATAAGDLPRLEISALRGQNIPQLRQSIHALFVREEEKEKEVILHLRQKLLLEDIHKALTQGRKALESGSGEEIFAEEIRPAVSLIGQLTGEIRADEVLEDIFSRFCIGK